MSLRGFAALFVSFCFAATGDVKGANQTSTVPKFTTKDRVVFIGDSITHGGSYHKDIFLFSATRYPHQPFKYYNAGISGDTAKGTMARFDQDIALHRPTKATIMLGMNDVGSRLYQSLPKTAKAQQQRKTQQAAIRKEYLANMRAIADALSQVNSEIIFITPSIYDQTLVADTFNNVGRNDELAVYAKELTNLARQYQAPVVDFQTPMLKINKKWQRQDPSRTIVSHDRVHPQELGHFLMAYSFLKAQHGSSFVADIQIDANRQAITRLHNAKLTQALVSSANQLAFACKLLALPFPLTSKQQSLLNDIPFQQDLNQQRLTVTGLAAGDYQLSIAGKKVGVYSQPELATGINLASNQNTPMYQQALAVKALNDERAKASGVLRNIKHVEFTMLSQYLGTDLTDINQVRDILAAHLELSAGKPWHDYLTRVIDSYLEYSADEQMLRNKIEDLFVQIYQVNQTKSHVWQLTKNLAGFIEHVI
ncbi:SGNH/GDSL hydrolase family protein [Paraglaciecola aquimarina]|uniref:SGNH/GDSL hydrolase family protein n=1 Tax=Paraglaciecola aquimarina TaxID=1235557 RepID=A0ABU3SYP0_9ALTE|nr:SGNH/GDSL hydrolase family protein [Paraglaciecola aquimarina]MDU0355138.1 SGNH/GDSL hydrolase family protein [Paraglaciecola aquimarina]